MVSILFSGKLKAQRKRSKKYESTKINIIPSEKIININTLDSNERIVVVSEKLDKYYSSPDMSSSDKMVINEVQEKIDEKS